MQRSRKVVVSLAVTLTALLVLAVLLSTRGSIEHATVSPIDFEYPFDPGFIAHDIPSKMEQGESYDVRARVARRANDQNVQIPNLKKRVGDLEWNGPVLLLDQVVSDVMALSLQGRGFDLAELSASKQAVLGGDFTEWAWTVTPTEAGERILRLRADVQVRLPGRQEDVPKTFTTTHEVHVEVSRWYEARVLLRSNWQYLASVIFIPLLCWLASKAWTAWKQRSGPAPLEL